MFFNRMFNYFFSNAERSSGTRIDSDPLSYNIKATVIPGSILKKNGPSSIPMQSGSVLDLSKMIVLDSIISSKNFIARLIFGEKKLDLQNKNRITFSSELEVNERVEYFDETDNLVVESKNSIKDMCQLDFDKQSDEVKDIFENILNTKAYMLPLNTLINELEEKNFIEKIFSEMVKKIEKKMKIVKREISEWFESIDNLTESDDAKKGLIQRVRELEVILDQKTERLNQVLEMKVKEYLIEYERCNGDL